jgi:hypothetical protein
MVKAMTLPDDRLARLLLIQGDGPSQLEDDLLRLDVVVRRVPQTVSANAVYQCGLYDGREAFHKPHEGMRDHPLLGEPVWKHYDQPSAIATGINECAAWRLARAMGPPWDTLVPTAVMRWLAWDAGLIGGWGPLVRKGNGPSGEMTPFNLQALCWPAALFDSLIGQQDRHLGNQRYEAATARLTLIDHGFAFPGGRWRFHESAFVDQRHKDGASALTGNEVALLDGLPGRSVWQELELMLTGDQMQALEWRRLTMHGAGELLPASQAGLAGP